MDAIEASTATVHRLASLFHSTSITSLQFMCHVVSVLVYSTCMGVCGQPLFSGMDCWNQDGLLDGTTGIPPQNSHY